MSKEKIENKMELKRLKLKGLDHVSGANVKSKPTIAPEHVQ